jgi:hypothetical protein
MGALKVDNKGEISASSLGPIDGDLESAAGAGEAFNWLGGGDRGGHVGYREAEAKEPDVAPDIPIRAGESLADAHGAALCVGLGVVVPVSLMGGVEGLP